jgi:hypothetical protein
MKSELGCGKTIKKYRTCGDISFGNKIILCKECKEDILYRIKETKKGIMTFEEEREIKEIEECLEVKNDF